MRAITLFLLIASLVQAGEIEVRVGRQTNVIPYGKFEGMIYYPDEPVSIISNRPLRFLLVAKDRTFLMQGHSFEDAVPLGVVLEPSEGYDQQYAGISSIYLDTPHKEILALFHAEKPTGGRNSENIPRYYGSVCLAVSTNKGASFSKVGPILTGKPEDPNWKGTAQGNGDPSICEDHTGEWLYAYYTEQSRQDPATGGGRSVITCMARSKIADRGRPGTWYKYYKGEFSEPGLGGKDTEIANVCQANVIYVPAIKKYVMLGNRDGVKLFLSDDGVKWDDGRVLFVMEDIPVLGKEIGIHPCLQVKRATAKSLDGFILYGYTPRFGTEGNQIPHYFVKRGIHLEVK